jgi:hypothetical protein
MSGFATTDLVALAMFGLMGAVLYRVAQRSCLPPLRLHPVITGRMATCTFVRTTVTAGEVRYLPTTGSCDWFRGSKDSQ